MALNKKIIKNNGLSTSYHKIRNVNMDCSGEQTIMTILIDSYADENYRIKEKNEEIINAALSTDAYIVEVDTKNDNLNFSNIYKKLKKLDVFEDATDC